MTSPSSINFFFFRSLSFFPRAAPNADSFFGFFTLTLGVPPPSRFRNVLHTLPQSRHFPCNIGISRLFIMRVVFSSGISFVSLHFTQ